MTSNATRELFTPKLAWCPSRLRKQCSSELETPGAGSCPYLTPSRPCVQWCAQTVPKCGSFQSVVEGAMLPALEKVKHVVHIRRSRALSEATVLK